MKSISPHALAIEMFGDGIVVGDRIVSAMERRIEAGDLNQVRTTGEERSNRREVVGLMQRRKDTVLFQARQHFAVDDNRAVVFRTAVNDAMADSNQIDRLRDPQPVSCDRNSRRNVGDFVGRVGFVDERRSVADSRRAAAAVCRCRPICPLMSRGGSPCSGSPNIWNLTLDDPALTTRIVSIGRSRRVERVRLRRRAAA